MVQSGVFVPLLLRFSISAHDYSSCNKPSNLVTVLNLRVRRNGISANVPPARRPDDRAGQYATLSAHTNCILFAMWQSICDFTTLHGSNVLCPCTLSRPGSEGNSCRVTIISLFVLIRTQRSEYNHTLAFDFDLSKSGRVHVL